MARNGLSWGLVLVVLGSTGCGSDGDGPTTKTGDTDVTETVGASGANLGLKSGAEVRIPEGALPSDTPISLREIEIERLAEPPSDRRALEHPVAMTPHGTRFERSVDVSLPRSEASLEVRESDIRILRLDDEEDRTWADVSGIEVRERAVDFRIDRFSIYVIAEQVSGDSSVDAGAQPPTSTRDAGGSVVNGDGDASMPREDSGATDSADASTDTSDAGTTDSADASTDTSDAGTSDAGTTDQADASTDTGDAGTGDAGTGDAGTSDGGPPDVECVQRLVECEEYCAPGDPESGICGMPTVDLASNPLHCGECGTTCAGNEACLDGSCIPAVLGQVVDEQTCVDCGTRQTNQGPRDHCVFPLSDSLACGSCGVRCDPGEVCTGGTCQPADCCNGGTRCGDECLDTSEDPRNCGGCDVQCDATEACVAEKCTSTCADELLRCGQKCVDPQTDDTACGGCAAGGSVDFGGCNQGGCETGSCECGFPTTCIDVQSDDKNCGNCGVACAVDNTCQQGQCACSQQECSTGECSCGQTCIDPNSDNNNCGRCGRACDANEECMGGACIKVSCDPGYVLCGQSSPYCFNGDACPTGTQCYDETSCVAGSCQ